MSLNGTPPWDDQSNYDKLSWLNEVTESSYDDLAEAEADLRRRTSLRPEETAHILYRDLMHDSTNNQG